jgi:hypothetical protein
MKMFQKHRMSSRQEHVIAFTFEQASNQEVHFFPPPFLDGDRKSETLVFTKPLERSFSQRESCC